MSLAENPDFDWPFQRGPNGEVNEIDQTSLAHVRACENVIARCPLNFRLDRPEFGWRFPTFRNVPLDPGELEAALRRWEPRGEASITEYADAANSAVRHFYTEIDVEAGSSG